MKVLVTGLGQRGLQWLELLSQLPDIELVAGVDPDPGRRESARKFLPGPERRLYPTLELALGDRTADAAFVCTPEHTHEAVMASCMDRGLGVLVEKPIAADMEQARRMIATAEHHDLPLLVGQNYRYSATELAIQRALREGLIGTPGFATCVQHRYRSPGMNYLRTHEYAQLDMAAHHFDNFRFYFDADIEAVTARAYTPPWSDYRHGAVTQALLTLAGDREVEVSYLGSFASQGDSFHLRIEGDRGQLEYDGKAIRYLVRGSLRSRSVPRADDVHPLDRKPPPFGGMYALVEELRRSLEGERDTPNCGRRNLNTFAALLAVRRSDAENRRVTVAEILHPESTGGGDA